MWLAEAGQPVYVPGVSHQQPPSPNCNHSSQYCSHHTQDLAEARPAEDLREDTPEERHPGTERESIQRLLDTHRALTAAVFTMRSYRCNVEMCCSTQLFQQLQRL